jgi:hypothetical protein
MKKVTYKKHELRKELGLTVYKFLKVFNKDIVERVLKYDYEQFLKIRVIPAFLAQRMIDYYRLGENVPIPREGIYEHNESRDRYATGVINHNTHKVELILLDDYGQLSPDYFWVGWKALHYEYNFQTTIKQS